MGKTYHHQPDDYTIPKTEPLVTHSTEMTGDWAQDCLTWRGVKLTGRYAHWCYEWDDLPMDETCPEWPCNCGIAERVDRDTPQS